MENPAASAAVATPETRKPWRVFASGAFRKLWLAMTLSLIGEFFNYIAMAWLVLQLTGSSLALGAVLTVQAVPRALLMLVGGALADRLSARLTMATSMGLRVACTAPLAILVLTGHVQLWEVYVFSALFGVFGAFFYPSQSAITPQVVSSADLEAANAVMNVTRQASVIGGPALAGLLVAAAGSGWAFAVDAACYLIGTAVVLWLPASQARPEGGGAKKGLGLAGQITDGIRYAWSDVGIRATLLIIAAVDFSANGALEVGLPTLSHGRFSAGAAGLGFLFGAWGVGATVGAAAAGIIRPPKRMGWLIVAVCAWIGAGIAVIGVVPTLAPATAVLGLTGIATGVINTYGVSWLQRRTDPAMQGRVMSLVMLASVGLVPISLAVSGAIAEVNPTLLFLVAGGLILLAMAGAASSRAVRSF
jgi:MFS family permease